MAPRAGATAPRTRATKAAAARTTVSLMPYLPSGQDGSALASSHLQGGPSPKLVATACSRRQRAEVGLHRARGGARSASRSSARDLVALTRLQLCGARP